MKTLLDVYNEPPRTDSPFDVGQTVRVLPSVVADGQTPDYWSGAKCEIISSRCSGFSKEWGYTLRHPNGSEDYFRAYELDGRYIKNRLKKKLTE